MAINGNGKIKGGIISVVGNAFFFLFFDVFDVLIPLIDLTVFLRFLFSFCFVYYIISSIDFGWQTNCTSSLEINEFLLSITLSLSVVKYNKLQHQ